MLIYQRVYDFCKQIPPWHRRFHLSTTIREDSLATPAAGAPEEDINWYVNLSYKNKEFLVDKLFDLS